MDTVLHNLPRNQDWCQTQWPFVVSLLWGDQFVESCHSRHAQLARMRWLTRSIVVKCPLVSLWIWFDRDVRLRYSNRTHLQVRSTELLTISRFTRITWRHKHSRSYCEPQNGKGMVVQKYKLTSKNQIMKMLKLMNPLRRWGQTIGQCKNHFWFVPSYSW